jgi:hypothetical protein
VATSRSGVLLPASQEVLGKLVMAGGTLEREDGRRLPGHVLGVANSTVNRLEKMGLITREGNKTSTFSITITAAGRDKLREYGLPDRRRGKQPNPEKQRQWREQKQKQRDRRLATVDSNGSPSEVRKSYEEARGIDERLSEAVEVLFPNGYGDVPLIDFMQWLERTKEMMRG